jgi:DNA primase
MFDAIAVDNNTIPLLGNTVNLKIINKIIEFKTPAIYLYLDGDAQKFIYRNCEKLIEYGIEPRIVTLPNNIDPGSLTKKENEEALKNYVTYDFNSKFKLKMLSKLK